MLGLRTSARSASATFMCPLLVQRVRSSLQDRATHYYTPIYPVISVEVCPRLLEYVRSLEWSARYCPQVGRCAGCWGMGVRGVACRPIAVIIHRSASAPGHFANAWPVAPTPPAMRAGGRKRRPSRLGSWAGPALWEGKEFRS